MSKEEKANRYAVENIDCESSIFRGLSIQSQDDIFDAVETAHLAGYTQAEQDLSYQLAAYKEALSLAYDLIHGSTEYEVGITRYKEGLLKINELLNLKP